MFKQIALPGTIKHGLVPKCHPVGLGEVAPSNKVEDVAETHKTVTVPLGVVESECNVYAQKLAELKRRESELVQEILRDEQKQKEGSGVKVRGKGGGDYPNIFIIRYTIQIKVVSLHHEKDITI